MDKEHQYWLYFTDDEGFLGYAKGIDDALAKSHIMKLNPGGRASITAMPALYFIPDEFCNRLLNKDEVMKFHTIEKN